MDREGDYILLVIVRDDEGPKIRVQSYEESDFTRNPHLISRCKRREGY